MEYSRRSFIAAGAGAATQAAPQPPSILVLLCDQLNPAVTSVYGGPVPTPNLERLARRGVLFRNATCPTPFCSPTRASIVTGLWPHRHGIVHNVMRIDYPSAKAPATEEGVTASDVTLESILHRRGYATHQYGKWHLSGSALPWLPDQYGEHREYAREMQATFDEVRRRPRDEYMDWYGWALPVSVQPWYRQSCEADANVRRPPYNDFVGKIGRLELPLAKNFDVRVAEKTVERLRALGNKPFAITCSLNAPHDPNVVPSPYYEQFDPKKIKLPSNHSAVEPAFDQDWSRLMVGDGPDGRIREFLRVYYGCTRLIDDQVGRVLDALQTTGRDRDTIVVFASDHGDMAGGHGMVWKSTSAFFDEVSQVPLIVSYPGHIRAGKSDAAVNLTGLTPTLLELTGHSVPSAMQGASFAPLLGGSSGSRFEHTFSERVAAVPGHNRRIPEAHPGSFMIRGGGWKYAQYRDGKEFLYNLQRDPGETRNLAAERASASVRAEMRRQLSRWLDDTGYPGGAPAALKT